MFNNKKLRNDFLFLKQKEKKYVFRKYFLII